MPEFDDLGSFDDLGDLDGISFDDPPAGKGPIPAPAAPQPAAPLSGLGTVIQDLMSRRNFQQVLQIAASQQDAVARDPHVAAMVQSARAHLEKEAFLANFLDAARQAFAAGKPDQARQFVEKARALDPGHPEVGAMMAHLARSAAPPPSPDVLSFDDPGPISSPPPMPSAPVFAPPPPAAAPSFAIDALSFDEPAPPIARPAPQVFNPPPPSPLDTSFGDLSFDAPTPGTAPSFGDRGLAFGETQTPGVSPSFAPAAPIPTPGTTPSFNVEGDRTQELLAEGQQHFDRQEYQLAIDVWSRIFLIDIENQEASRRIEAARQQRAERERRAEEYFAKACTAIENKALDEAKNWLEQALAANPGHAQARDFLDQLHSGKTPLVRRAEEASLDLLDDGGLGDLQKAAGVRQTGQTLEAAVARDRIVVVKKTDRKLIAAAVLGGVVLLGGIGYVVTNWEKLFPKEKETTDVAARPTGSLERAKKIFDSGKIENAIALVEKMAPTDPDYKEAQTLLAQWKAMVKTGEGAETGPAPELVARRAKMLEAGRDAHRQGQFLRARKFFERAAKIQPLESADQTLKEECDVKLANFEAEIATFNSGAYEELLPQLWRIRDANPNNLDIRLLMIDCYYNLAVSDLQRGLTDQAKEKLKEAVALAPDNDELVRLKSFAESYATKEKDLRYRTLVKYLPLRG